MKKSAEIRQELTALVSSQQNLIDALTKESRSAFSTEEQQKFDDLQSQIDAKKQELRNAENLEENARLFGGSGSSQMSSEEREMQNLRKNYSIHKVMQRAKDAGPLEGIEKEVSDEYKAMAIRSGVPISGYAIPIGTSVEKRADGQTVTQDSGNYGGNLVQTDVQSPIDFLRPKLVMQSLGATYLTGLVGNLKFPKNNGGISATWEGEIDTVGKTKNAIGSIEMTPKRLAGSFLVSLQNLIQTGGLIERMTVNDMNAVIALAIDRACINGNGAGIDGILNTTGIGSVAGGTNGAAPSWDNLVKLETAIASNNADVNSMAYLINAVTRGKLKTTPKVSGMPEYLMDRDGMVNGYKTAVTNLVPSDLTKGTANGVCSAAVFGDFSQLMIGTWAFADLTVDRVTQIESGYVKYVINTFNDIAVREPKAFAAIKDILTA